MWVPLSAKTPFFRNLENCCGLLFWKQLGFANFAWLCCTLPSSPMQPLLSSTPFPSLTRFLSHTHVCTLTVSPSLFPFTTAADMTQRSCRNHISSHFFLLSLPLCSLFFFFLHLTEAQLLICNLNP